MKKNVILSLRSEQRSADGEKDVTELTAEGTLTAADWGWQLDYEESALTGMEGTHTTVRVRPGSVTLLRTGTFRSRMRFEVGKKHAAPYETPYGALTMAVAAYTLRAELTEDGGTLEIGYAMEIEQQLMGDYRLFLRVRPAGDRSAPPVCDAAGSGQR